MPEFEYTGEERRGHCDVHQHNTSTLENNSLVLAGILTGIKIIAWMIVLGFPTAAGLAAYFGNTLDNKLEAISTNVQAIATGQIVSDAKISALQSEQKDIKDRLCSLEERRR